MDEINLRKIQYRLIFHSIIHQDRNEIQAN